MSRNGVLRAIRAAVLVTGGLGLADVASALPAFARRYQVACQLCHTGYPRLNEVGQRFKDRGFRLEREDQFAAKRWINSVPLSVRVVASQLATEKADDDSIAWLRVASAGNLGPRWSYWIEDGVESRNAGSLSHKGPDDLYLRYELGRSGKVYVRAGRMERDLPFTQVRSPHVVAYEIYDALGADGLGGHRDGLEMGCNLPHGWHFSGGVYAGANSSVKSDFSVFMRGSRRFGPQGKQRLGLLGEWGWKAPPNQTELAQSTSPPPISDGSNLTPLAQTVGVDVHRIGLDVDLKLERINVYGLYVYGRYGIEPVVQGGFVQTDYQLDHNVSLTLRGQLLSRQPPAAAREQQLSVVPGIQVLIASRLKLSFGYAFWSNDRPSAGQLQVEAAF